MSIYSGWTVFLELLLYSDSECHPHYRTREVDREQIIHYFQGRLGFRLIYPDDGSSRISAALAENFGYPRNISTIINSFTEFCKGIAFIWIVSMIRICCAVILFNEEPLMWDKVSTEFRRIIYFFKFLNIPTEDSLSQQYNMPFMIDFEDEFDILAYSFPRLSTYIHTNCTLIFMFENPNSTTLPI